MNLSFSGISANPKQSKNFLQHESFRWATMLSDAFVSSSIAWFLLDFGFFGFLGFAISPPFFFGGLLSLFIAFKFACIFLTNILALIFWILLCTFFSKFLFSFIWFEFSLFFCDKKSLNKGGFSLPFEIFQKIILASPKLKPEVAWCLLYRRSDFLLLSPLLWEPWSRSDDPWGFQPWTYRLFLFHEFSGQIILLMDISIQELTILNFLFFSGFGWG